MTHPQIIRRLIGLTMLAGCARPDTRTIEPERETRLAAETIRHRAANLTFRFTHDAGTTTAGWEDRLASIVVTDSTVLIHKNAKIGLEIVPTSRRFYEVARDGDRVRINAGTGKSRESWSFVPPDSAAGWTESIRRAIRQSKSAANR